MPRMRWRTPDPLVCWGEGGAHPSPRTPPPRRLQHHDPHASLLWEQGRQWAKAGPGWRHLLGYMYIVKII